MVDISVDIGESEEKQVYCRKASDDIMTNGIVFEACIVCLYLCRQYSKILERFVLMNRRFQRA